MRNVSSAERLRRAACVGQVDAAGIDILLVGDSVGMVVHGHDTTLPVTLEDMLLHCRAVSRGARRRAPLTVSRTIMHDANMA